MNHNMNEKHLSTSGHVYNPVEADGSALHFLKLNIRLEKKLAATKAELERVLVRNQELMNERDYWKSRATGAERMVLPAGRGA
jgi:hypothetical protein